MIAGLGQSKASHSIWCKQLYHRCHTKGILLGSGPRFWSFASLRSNHMVVDTTTDNLTKWLEAADQSRPLPTAESAPHHMLRSSLQLSRSPNDIFDPAPSAPTPGHNADVSRSPSLFVWLCIQQHVIPAMMLWRHSNPGFVHHALLCIALKRWVVIRAGPALLC